jgi:hypothetical protein
MSYSTGTATGANDLLDKLRLFAIAEGWTVNRWTSVTGGYELCVSKGTSYFNLRSGENTTLLVNGASTANKYGILINGSDGYDSGDDWDRQDGYSRRDITPSGTDQYVAFLPLVTNLGALPAYYFFSDSGGDNIYLELEVSTGTYQRLGFGQLDLYDDTIDGDGRFFYATGAEHVTDSTSGNTWLGSEIGSTYSLEEVPFRSSQFNLPSAKSGSAVRLAFDSFDNWAGSGNSSTTTYLEESVTGFQNRVIMQAAPNPLNGVGVLARVEVYANQANVSYHPVGEVLGMRYLDLTNYQPGDEFTLGSDTWKVFPWYSKGGRSFEFGIAYLKVT